MINRVWQQPRDHVASKTNPAPSSGVLLLVAASNSTSRDQARRLPAEGDRRLSHRVSYREGCRRSCWRPFRFSICSLSSPHRRLQGQLLGSTPGWRSWQLNTGTAGLSKDTDVRLRGRDQRPRLLRVALTHRVPTADPSSDAALPASSVGGPPNTSSLCLKSERSWTVHPYQCFL